MTTPQRWQEIDRIFAAALEREPAERAAFLDEACAGDEQLRNEVESLLAHDTGESLVGSHAVEEATRLLAGGEKRASPGDQIGSYLITGSIGSGGMGEVYLAKDKLGRMVALKLLNQHFERDEAGVARFQQEARTLLALNHPHIVTIYDIDQVDSVYYIASELVEGETIRQRLDQGDVDLMVALEVAIQVATALAAAHEKGIVHRDIKPENIMIRRDGYVKVLDFGIAKLTEVQTATDLEAPTIRQVLTAEGTVVGTAAYMSPEQARGLPVDARTDVWSLGVVLYEVISGRKPFLGDTMQDVIGSVLQKEPPPLARYAHGIPDGLEWIVSRALRKEREARYQTANELLFDLKELKRKIEFTKSMSSEAGGGESLPLERAPGSDFRTTAPLIPSSKPSSAEYIVTGIKRHRLVFIFGLLTLAAAVVGLAAYFQARINAAAIQSIAVLPFVNASGNGEVEYLSDGMTDMLITSLSQLPQLSVKARSSVFRYKGKDASPQQLGKELNVQAILTGRLVQRGNDITLHIELVDVKTETALWSADYNRSMTNLAALQSEIAHDVAEKLRLRLTSTEQQRLTKRGTENAEAYRAYLKGIFYWNKGLAPGYEKSREYFQQAIDLDPTYALAYSGLGVYYAFASTVGLLPPNENWPKAEAAANKALALDDTLAETHNLLAAVKLYYYRDWPAAERYFRRGIELNPNFAEIHAHYAGSLMSFGRNEEALAEVQRSVELDPLSPRFNYSWGRILFFMRQGDRAIDQFRKTLELDPNSVPAYELLGDAYEQKGMQREAITEWGKALTLRGAGEQASILERAYAASGFEAAVRALGKQQLEKLNERMKRGEYVPAAEYVMAYNRMGDKEQAFAWLDKAVQESYGFALVVRVDPIFDKLRDDPRFQASLRKVGF